MKYLVLIAVALISFYSGVNYSNKDFDRLRKVDESIFQEYKEGLGSASEMIECETDACYEPLIEDVEDNTENVKYLFAQREEIIRGN